MHFLRGNEVGVRTGRTVFTKVLARGATSVALIVGFASIVPTLAAAAGSTTNTISAGAAPVAASKGGAYTPSATATSKDAVVITLDHYSSGCSLGSGKVKFTGSGTCLVDFNDPGNSIYAAAAQVQKSIKVYSANVITVSKAPAAGSASGSYSPGATATSSDTVVRSLASTSSGCILVSNKVTFTGSGTCLVDFNDVGNGAFAAANQVRQSIKVYAANTILTSTPPAAGTVNGTYATSASATSKDTVIITLDTNSTGCSLYKADVTFTSDGICRIDFNDAGNGAFGPADQIQQVIIVGPGGQKTQATLVLASTNGTYGAGLTLTSSGGSGTGAVSYVVTSVGTAGCSIQGGTLSATRVGTCSVTATKSADATYALAHSPPTTVTFAAHYPPSPKAFRMGSPVWTGRSVMTTITGTGFYGQPRLFSNVSGTRVNVVRDNGRVLTVRVTVASGTLRGVHTFTIVFAHGERSGVRYNQR